MNSYFPPSYEDSRARFLLDLERIRFKWPLTRLGAHPLKDHPSLGIDWLWAEPRKHDTLVIVTTGQHGIEGYAGAAMLKIFMQEFAPRLDHTNTGLLLVHAINPWGMQHRRKVNENGVDLNRNFISDGNFDPALNPDFKMLADLLTPGRPVRSAARESLSFWWRVLKAILTVGTSRLSTAALLGQHHTPEGFFYGGQGHEEGTSVLMALYQKALEEYRSVVQMDMHTGYGPRHQMNIIIPPAEPLSSRQAAHKFGYPRVQKIDAREFYAIHGDMGEYFYRLRDAHHPGKGLFACGFEFGTFGDSLPARLRSLRAMVLENQLHHHGAQNERARKWVRREFDGLYFPTRAGWQRKALADCRRAFEGILKAYDLLATPALQPRADPSRRS
jgi:hypothetical protein